MKKSLIIKILAVLVLIVLIISIILNKSSEHIDEIRVSLYNNKIIKIYDYKSKILINTYDRKYTQDIVEKLSYDKWSASNGLNGDEKKYLLKLYTDEDSDSFAEITIYESNDYISVFIPEKINNKIYKTNNSLKNLFDL